MSKSEIVFIILQEFLSFYNFSYKYGRNNAPETDDLKPSEVHVVYDHVPDELVPLKGAARVKWVFLSAIASTKEEAMAAYHEGRY